MRKINFKKQNHGVYFVLIDDEIIGTITYKKKGRETIVNYSFDEKRFDGLYGVILLNEILDFSFAIFDDVEKSKVCFNGYKDANYYGDTFKIKTESNENMTCYYKTNR